MKKFVLAAALLTALLFSGCATSAENETTAHTREVFAMDTVMTLQAYGDHAETALDEAVSEIERLDALFSISSIDGDIARLNADKTLHASADTVALLQRAEDIAASTGGLFDITIAPLMDAWGFTSGSYQVPDAATIANLLANVDHTQVQLSGNTVTLPNNVTIDLGGIAKGFTSDRIMAIFSRCGVTSGVISLGGNVQTLGEKPDGSLWRVGIQDPADTSRLLATLEVANQAVITSGGYQRFFEKNGVTYHHIIDPRTGYPADSGLTSVTIVSGDGTLADGLSTALFIMGHDAAIDYWRSHRETFDMVLVEADGTVTISEGLNDNFTLNGDHTLESIQ
ncbi:MAG: FAD:protein FMN transferase [Peptococcaceae bacterium]|nr:FAD:protein FMN transferase [Peptococcaceae bacterium]